MQVQLLGPLRVRDGDRTVAIEAPLQRTLLVALAVHAHEPVSVDRLIEALWGAAPPSGGVKTLRYHVSKLRDALGDEDHSMVRTQAPGYVLGAGVQLDVDEFAKLVAEARASARDDPTAARRRLEAGLGLWRGAVLSEFEYADFAQPLIARLTEEHLAAEELGFEMDLALGLHDEVLPELRAVSEEHPYREGLRGLLVTALYRAGRQTEALRELDRTRRLLCEELGIDLSPVLRELEGLLLVQDSRLAAPPEVGRGAPSTNLAPDPRRFVGRSDDVLAIRELLVASRLVTLTGPGGVGKTRLALQVAAAEQATHRDGTWLVDLTRAREARMVPSLIGEVLDVRIAPGSAAEDLARALSGQHMLLVLDNFEHVMDAALVVADLLAASDGLRVLVTSREPLRLRSEQRYPVPVLNDAEAVELFAVTAQQVRPDFAADAATTQQVAAICAAVDHLPLAIELAASRLDVVGAEELRHRLSSRLGILTRGSRDMPERHQTLRRTIDWSYELLEPSEQALFMSLAAFGGAARLEAIEYVAGTDVMDGLQTLTDKSLVHAVSGPDRSVRYQQLATVREYAAERLAEHPDETALRTRFVNYYVELGQRTGPLLYEAGGASHYALLNAEVDNLAHALAWAFADGDPLQGCRLLGALHGFWLMEGHGPLVAPFADEARRLLGELEPRAHAEVGFVLSGNLDAGNPKRRAETSRRALEQARHVGDPGLIAMNLCHHAVALHEADQAAFPTARSLLDEAVAEAEGAAPGFRSMALSHIGLLADEHGDLDRAVEAQRRHRDISEEIGHWRGIVFADFTLSSLLEAQGDADEALRLGRRGLQMACDRGRHPGFVSLGLPVVAHALIAAGQPEPGAVLLAAGIEACRRNGRLDPDGRPMGGGREHDRATARLVETLEPDALRVLQTKGRAMSMDKALYLALDQD